MMSARWASAFTVRVARTPMIGAGANSAIFSTIDAVMIRALPYADPDRVVMVWEDVSSMGFARNTPAPGNYNDWVQMNQSFSAMAATRGAAANLTSDGSPEALVGRRVTPNFFAVLGVQPAIGRTFSEEENKASAPVVLISYGLWERRYGGDRAILGRTLVMNGKKDQVIGGMARHFGFRKRKNDYWTPGRFPPAVAVRHGPH